MIIVSLSGGKDSTAMLLHLVEHYGPEQLLVHHQVLPEDWEETVPYVRETCSRLRVPLVMQQMIYQPVGEDKAVRRNRVVDIHSQSDVVPWGTGMIAGVTDLALRRRWPPSPAARACTTYFKVGLLNWWIIRKQREMELGYDVIVALGERHAESARRAKKQEWAPRVKSNRGKYKVWNWEPVITWSRRDVFRKLFDHGIIPHPAYREQGMTTWQMYDADEEGGPRTSCRACIYASHADVCHQAQSEAARPVLQRIDEVERTIDRTWWMDGRTAGKYLKEGCFEQVKLFT